MSKIVERLRAYATSCKATTGEWPHSTDCAEAADEIERMHAKLTTVCRQWKMYAEMEESRDLLHEQSPEGELYRSVCADYASHEGH